LAVESNSIATIAVRRRTIKAYIIGNRGKHKRNNATQLDTHARK
jgi:hypothetical protein